MQNDFMDTTEFQPQEPPPEIRPAKSKVTKKTITHETAETSATPTEKAPVVTQPIVIPEKKTLPPLVVDPETHLYVIRDQLDLQRVLRQWHQGKALPSCLDSDEMRMAAIQFVTELNPKKKLLLMQNLMHMNGRFTTWGETPKALAEATGEMSECQVIYFDDSQDVICLKNKNLQSPVWGTVVQMQRSKRHKNEYFFTKPEAIAAGLWENPKKPVWKLYPKTMLLRRAMGQAIKFEFPDAVQGLAIAEHDFDQAPDLVDVTPTSSQSGENAAKQLNATLTGEQQ